MTRPKWRHLRCLSMQILQTHVFWSDQIRYRAPTVHMAMSIIDLKTNLARLTALQPRMHYQMVKLIWRDLQHYSRACIIKWCHGFCCFKRSSICCCDPTPKRWIEPPTLSSDIFLCFLYGSARILEGGFMLNTQSSFFTLYTVAPTILEAKLLSSDQCLRTHVR